MEYKISLLVIAFSVIIQQSCSQKVDARFVVKLGLFNDSNIRCAGTLISPQHILTAASCIKVEPPSQITIRLEYDGGLAVIVDANRVFIHPHYNYNQNVSNNAAIVMTNTLITHPAFGFVPRSLGALTASSSCSLFGWGGAELDPRRDEVMINAPQSCDPDYSQNFCTIFDLPSNPTCSALLGSPLTCGNNMAVAGFLTNDQTCETNASRTTLNYHSVNYFRDWIEGVLGPELHERNPVDYIVTVMQFTPPTHSDATSRCFGTIITANQILTTASCVSVQAPFAIAVETRIVQGPSTYSSILTASAVYIYPNYSQENIFMDNVAIIEMDGTFDERIVPRSLGSLKSNSSCQLFGWGPSSLNYTRGDVLTVLESKYCNTSLPQAFCSNHPTIFHYTCNAMTGSPVSCGDESVVDGFLINNASCSTNDDGGVSLYFHSVGQFSEWILDNAREPSIAVLTKISSVFIIFAVVITSLIH